MIRKSAAIVAGLFVLLVLLACGGARVPDAQKETKQEKNSDKDSPAPDDKPGEAKIGGEPYRSGDLLVSIRTVYSNGPFGGQYRGRYANTKLTLAMIEVRNTSAGKIVAWPGWHGKAALEDEHGNRFAPFDLRGWSALPHNNTLGDGWDGDTGAKIHPGTTYTNALYYEFVPPTSKRVKVTGQIDGRTVTFSGPFGVKAP